MYPKNGTETFYQEYLRLPTYTFAQKDTCIGPEQTILSTTKLISILSRPERYALCKCFACLMISSSFIHSGLFAYLRWPVYRGMYVAGSVTEGAWALHSYIQCICIFNPFSNKTEMIAPSLINPMRFLPVSPVIPSTPL